MELSNILKEVTNMLSNLWKLNKVNITTLTGIVAIGIGAFFCVKLFTADAFMDKLLNGDPTTIGILVVLILIINGIITMIVIKGSLEKKDEKNERKHTKSMERRRTVNPKIRAAIDEAVTEIDSHRGMCAEYHNGSENPSKLGFSKFDENYEVVNKKYPQVFVADQYQDMKTSFYAITDFIHDHDSFIGSVDELEEIDARYAANMKNDGMVYSAIAEVRNVYNENRPLGILSLSWGAGEIIPPMDEIEDILRKCESNVRVLLTFKER